MIPKLAPIRDRAYLDHVRTEPCLIDGIRGPDVDPCHISTSGKGIKSPDNEVIPLRNSWHRLCHQRGEISVLRQNLPDYVLREALKCYAREQYTRWLKEKS